MTVTGAELALKCVLAIVASSHLWHAPHGAEMPRSVSDTIVDHGKDKGSTLSSPLPAGIDSLAHAFHTRQKLRVQCGHATTRRTQRVCMCCSNAASSCGVTIETVRPIQGHYDDASRSTSMSTARGLKTCAFIRRQCTCDMLLCRHIATRAVLTLHLEIVAQLSVALGREIGRILLGLQGTLDRRVGLPS
jgi:hypothetical protein